MRKKEFIEFWVNNFPKINTINYQLRDVLEDRWFRIHNLPDSKRYPENQDENKLILDRSVQRSSVTIRANNDISKPVSDFEFLPSQNLPKP